MVVAVGSLSTGLVINGKRHGAMWRSAWALLGVSLTLLTVDTLWSALTTQYGAGGPVFLCIEAVSVGLAAAGVLRLLASRVAGRAADVLLEGTIIAAACTYVAWAWMAAQGMDHVASALALFPVFLWVLVVWLTGRLVYLTPDQIAGYRILGAAFVALLFVDALLVGSKFGGGSLDRGQLIGITLCAYCLWGIAARHPSMCQNFAPTKVEPAPFGALKLGAHLSVAIVAPVSLLLLPTTRESPGITALVTGSALLPILLVGYLARQVRGRARAEYRAQHDELTGLANRRLFEDRANIAFRDAQRSATKVAVLFLDLDRFKAINDSLGHAVGNQLLQGVARRLSASMREIDTVARFGGDEFTILISSPNGNDEVAEMARAILDLFARPFSAGGRELHTRPSIGIALYPEDGGDLETLLKNADVAMYRAKTRGRNAFEFYTPGLAIRAQTKMSVESGLRQALDHRTLELHYQPQVDVKTGKIFGLEALARWHHPKLGMIPPNVFIPVAEESDLIVALGEWALDETCAQARRWLDSGISPRVIAVNISARHFASDGFVDLVQRTLTRHSIPPGILEIEITESIFMRDLDRASIALAELREIGVRCAIDDFGTGFSGLRYLADMSIDSLKIDQSFVSCVHKEQDDSPIIDAIIGLSQRLNLDVVAEGVETDEQLAFLVSQGCTRMQGYLFARPAPASDIERLLKRDDNAEIDWLAIAREVIDLTKNPADVPRPNETARLLGAICSSPDEPLDIDTSGLPGLLEALASDRTDTDKSRTLLMTSLRITAGTCVALSPLAGGLAAADALPNPVQSVVAATAHAIGIELPSPASATSAPVVASSARSATKPQHLNLKNNAVTVVAQPSTSSTPIRRAVASPRSVAAIATPKMKARVPAPAAKARYPLSRRPNAFGGYRMNRVDKGRLPRRALPGAIFAKTRSPQPTSRTTATHHAYGSLHRRGW